MDTGTKFKPLVLNVFEGCDGKRIGRILVVLAIVLSILTVPWDNSYGGWQELEDLRESVGLRCLPDQIDGDQYVDCNVLPKVYARVKYFPAPVYRGNLAPYLLKPKRLIHKGFVWVSLESDEIIKFRNRQWLKINSDEFIERRFLAFHRPPTFRGVRIDGKEVTLPFIWLILDTTPSRVPGGPIDYNAPTIKRYSRFSVKRVKYVDGEDWYEVGKNKWINQKRVALVTTHSRPQEVGEGEKWIYVDLYEQTLVAYEGDRPVYATLISSGIKRFPTVEGLFRIWLKVESKKMSGEEHTQDYYYLEDVPWQMYFYSGYAIHSSYWHDRFGIRQSSGCVNVAPYDAWWLFQWTEPRLKDGEKMVRASRKRPGTWVYIVQRITPQ